MINVEFIKNKDNQFLSFIINGHANYDDYGNDIVCSAVSAVSIGTVNSIVSIAKFKPNVYKKNKGGYLKVSIPIKDVNNSQLYISQILLNSLYIELQGISKNYPKNVLVKLKKN